jgi:hypothetical protein
MSWLGFCLNRLLVRITFIYIVARTGMLEFLVWVVECFRRMLMSLNLYLKW